MTARKKWAAAIVALCMAGQLLDGTRGLTKVAYIVGGVLALAVVVHLIDHLDRWGREAHPSLRIVVPEQTNTSNVVVLADRKAS